MPDESFDSTDLVLSWNALVANLLLSRLSSDRHANDDLISIQGRDAQWDLGCTVRTPRYSPVSDFDHWGRVEVE